ncbi:MAG: hydroxyquinol 1,2-dioxygenase [Burkholderiaceae bacterium]
MTQQTRFASLADYRKGEIELISGSRKEYAFSNIFEVADTSKPYERVAVGKNLEYVQEAVRAEGESGWYLCAHDEFAVCMDGAVEVELLKPDDARALVPEDKNGAISLGAKAPSGRKMGVIRLKRGHQAMLNKDCAYRFRADKPAVLLIQTILGDVTIEKWAKICLQ